ncbi:hypothetical protein FHT44_006730 [Mycolicibacterium sp. BK634]|uniref:VWA domain-containing protein n=1 Tax=Mycolicibacterium sp. BK634 TaxID=2587099 RepID=UPI00160F9EF4|nr:VWA domain-containing protein [Mycolicibacterium sp. BK634]MBB3754208.1 hypothetical protein [Mycolicibacterium sp. BK634]
MTFYPVIPLVPLLIGAGILLVIRMVALYRILVRTGPGRYRRVVARWSGLTLAILFIVMAALRPGFDSDQASQSIEFSGAKTDQNVNVFFVVDRSVNSRVEDYGAGKSRMSGMRTDIGALIDEYSHARFGLISFAGKAGTDWPLSDDAWSLHSMVQGLSPYTLVTADAMYQTDAFAARDVLSSKVEEAGKLFPGSTTVVFYLGEGAPGSRVAPSSFDLPAGAIAGGAVLGYGTAAGGPIPLGWSAGNKVYAGDPGGGAPLNSAIDEGRLKEVASQLGVPYFHRESAKPISGAVPVIELKDQHNDAAMTLKLIDRWELYWVFALLAVLLVLIEIVATIREYRRNRMSWKDAW